MSSDRCENIKQVQIPRGISFYFSTVSWELDNVECDVNCDVNKVCKEVREIREIREVKIDIVNGKNKTDWEWEKLEFEDLERG